MEFCDSEQMYPALLLVSLKILIGRIAVRDDDTVSLFSQGFFWHALASRVLNHILRAGGCRKHPEPPVPAVHSPARLVGIHGFCFLDKHDDGGIVFAE